jgi:hypothetical protein
MASLPISVIHLDDQFLVGPALDLTLYAADLTQPEFDALFGLYQALCPDDRRTRWKVAEDFFYQPYREAGTETSLNSPAMERFRYRVANGWRAEFRVWDGRAEETWSFACYRLPRTADLPPAAFYRFLLPATADPAILRRAAETVVRSVPLLSGHGGYTLLYDGSRLSTAFNRIYPLARRYWGLDVEHLNSTMRLMRGGIKGVSWLTLIGPGFLEKLGGSQAFAALAEGEISVTAGMGGMLIAAGPVPLVLDQNRPSPELSRYQRIAQAAEPVFLPEFPDLPGRFLVEGNSSAWQRRFLEPGEWRR